MEYSFHEFDNEVKTVYVFEERSSPNLVEHYMLKDLAERIKELNPRYRVGIIYEEKNPEVEEFNDIKESYLDF